MTKNSKVLNGEIIEKKEKPAKKMSKAEKQKIESRNALSIYIRKNQVSDFTKIPYEQKLTLLNSTPKDLIEYRQIGNTKIPYVPHEYCEKALNFVFNFNVSNEILKEELRTEKYMKPIYKNNKKIGEKEMEKYIARVTVRFTFLTTQKNEITRTVISTHIGYENPATSDGDALKSAVSKSWTVVARTFGIGADIKPDEKKAYAKAEAYTPQPVPVPPAKTKTTVKKTVRSWEK